MSESNLEIRLLDDTVLTGNHPLVLLGPNGSGKSRYGSQLAAKRNYERIPALRTLNFSKTLPMQSYKEANDAYRNKINNSRNTPTEQIDDFIHVLSLYKAEDTQYAVDYRNHAQDSSDIAPPKITRLGHAQKIWEDLFPGRQISFASYVPQTIWTLEGRATNQYSISEMSDGERVALYLLLRVLRADPGVILIDEPEVHFHSLLARNFWDRIEIERPDCRFVYITHDLNFALTRNGGQVGLVRTPDKIEIIPENEAIPDELFQTLLGVASFSVSATRVVFCEGNIGGSIDYQFYSLWFSNPGTVVIPVGSCTSVCEAVRSFRTSPLISGMEVVGIVDRDYWPESKLESFKDDGIFVLDFHEIESLFCQPDIVQCVCKHLSIGDVPSIIQKFENKLKEDYTGVRAQPVILERAKRAMEVSTFQKINSLSVKKTTADTISFNTTKLNSQPDAENFKTSFFDSEQKINCAINNGIVEILTIIPGKQAFGTLCNLMGVAPKIYIKQIYASITTGGTKIPDELYAIEGILSPFLPQR